MKKTKNQLKAKNSSFPFQVTMGFRLLHPWKMLRLFTAVFPELSSSSSDPSKQGYLEQSENLPLIATLDQKKPNSHKKDHKCSSINQVLVSMTLVRCF